jgi:predicted transcriptional regulator
VPTLSKRLYEAIHKDLKDAFDEASYETYDCCSTLNTLQELGVDAMPYTQAIIKEIKQIESNNKEIIWNIQSYIN